MVKKLFKLLLIIFAGFGIRIFILKVILFIPSFIGFDVIVFNDLISDILLVVIILVLFIISLKEGYWKRNSIF